MIELRIIFKICLAALLLLNACSKPKDPHAEHLAAAAEASDKSHSASGASLYQLHDYFTDQNGKRLMLHQFEGKYVVLTMFYTTCTAICPRLTAEMVRLERSLTALQQAKTRFVMITVDPERDTPLQLTKFIDKMHLSDAFTLLTGSEDSIREVSVVLGINYKKTPGADKKSYEFAHTSKFTLLSPKGEILLQNTGLAIDSAAFGNRIAGK